MAGLLCYDSALCFSVGREKRGLAEICVKAVLAVADLERKDVNLDLIKVLLFGFQCSDCYRLLSVAEQSSATSVMLNNMTLCVISSPTLAESFLCRLTGKWVGD